MIAPPCTRCGKCCQLARACSLHGWLVRDKKGHPVQTWKGTCSQLEIRDGIASCKVIQFAIEHPEECDEDGRKWLLEEFVGQGCELVLQAERFSQPIVDQREPKETKVKP